MICQNFSCFKIFSKKLNPILLLISIFEGNNKQDMSSKVYKFFLKAIIILLIVHFSYFLYGYFKFEGLGNIDIYTEFYRFKFYDDVSISHFFVSNLFLFFFLIILIRKHARQQYKRKDLLKISLLLLLISVLSFSFFVSYSFGMNAKLRTELPEDNFNKDKTLLNVLNPFLYKYTSYSSEKLFNVVNILYPKPYPVIEEVDSTKVSDDYYITESKYYSIDTVMLLTATADKMNNQSKALLDSIGFDEHLLSKRIIDKETVKDSTRIIYKGRGVNPRYDNDICIFLENNLLFTPVNGVSITQQKYNAAVSRHNLIYKYGKDSLALNFKKLDTLLKKYNIESEIKPADLANDVLYYRDHNTEPLNNIRNRYDRDAMSQKMATLNKLFYHPNYLHPSIISIYFAVITSAWLFLVVVYMLFNNKKIKAV